MKKYILLLAILCSTLFTSCTNFTIPTNANTAFQNFTLCLFQQEVSSNTINLHYSLQNPEKYGITDTPITLGAFQSDSTASLAVIENWDAALHKFSHSSLSKENQLTYDILSYYFDLLKTGASYSLYEEPLSPVTGIHAQLPVLLAEYQFTEKEDVQTYLALLETLPDYFSSLCNFEYQKSNAGLFMSDTTADAVIEQCNAFIAMGDENYLLSTFEERVKNMSSLSSKDVSDFVQQNKKVVTTSVLPAYENLASTITNLKGTEKNTQGLCYFPEGKDYYSYLAASGTGSSRTVEELKILIQNQIAADLMDSQLVLEQNSSYTEETASINQSPDTILRTLKTEISNAFPNAIPVNVQVKYVPNTLEEYLSPAFYLIPAIDNYNENTIFINRAHSLDDLHLFTTLAHEGYPGHLYQTTYYAATKPDPIRTLLNFKGYVEGWATYAEMCSYYLTTLEKPYATLLQKNSSIILGLYSAADIGIHYDGWSFDETLTFFSTYGIEDRETIREIYELIIGDPANYLSYYIGYVEILELKKEAIKKQGEDFSQKEFHQRLLEIGPAPFEIIESQLYVKQR